MLNADRITIVLPETARDIQDLAQDIITVARAYRRDGEEREDAEYLGFVAWLMTAPHVLTMAYVDGKPVGWIRIDDHDTNPDEVGRKCLEFSGAVCPEYEGEGLSEAVAPIAIERAFALNDASKIIAVTDGANPKAAAGLQRLGFNYRATDTQGRRIYRILRKDYLAQTN